MNANIRVAPRNDLGMSSGMAFSLKASILFKDSFIFEMLHERNCYARSGTVTKTSGPVQGVIMVTVPK